MTTEGSDGWVPATTSTGPRLQRPSQGVADIWVPMRLDIHALMLITECGRRAVSARARSRRYLDSLHE